MRISKFIDDARFIEQNKYIYKSLLAQSKIIIEKLNVTYNLEEFNILTKEIVDNSFAFSFWGLNFLVKAEIEINPERNVFYLGELNTYIQFNEEEVLIHSYNFDGIGNINQEHTIEYFAKEYYYEFVAQIIEYSKSNHLKFQIK